MTLSEFSTKYNLSQAAIEALLKKINVTVNTEIDEELEGILLNLSGTRIPLYPSSRLSALSPAELSVLLAYYELHIEPTTFFEDGFVPFGNMLFSLLKETGKTIDIPATVIVELNRRLSADPDSQKLGTLKTLIIQMTKSGRGIVSPNREAAGLSFGEMVFRRHPGKNIAILAKNSAIPQSLCREAERENLHVASFYLDSRGFMRVSQDILIANQPAKPAAPAVPPRESSRPEPAAPASPVMTAAGTLQTEQLQTLPQTTPSQARTSLLSRPPQPFQPLSDHAANRSPAQTQAPEAAYPVGIPRETVPPAPPPAGTYPAYPIRDITQLTPGAVPHPFPGPDTQPSKPPVRMEPFSPPPPPVHPVPPVSSAASTVEAPPSPSSFPPNRETPPVAEGIPAKTAAPSEPVQNTSPAPEVPVSDDSPEILPPGVVRNEQGKLVKHGRLRKAGSKKGPESAKRPDSSLTAAPAPESLEPPPSPAPVPAADDAGPRTMRERFVQGMDNPRASEEQTPRPNHNEVKKLSKLLAALYAVLAVLGLGIIGLLLYQLL